MANIVQAGAVLTVSESKRLIARAVARMPLVQEALTDGMVIICKGTTNTYVAEEILGEKIAHGAFVSGRVYPTESGDRIGKPSGTMGEIVIVKGEVQDGLPLAEAVKDLKYGDVVIKGANVLDYENRAAGVLIGALDGGTCGTIMPFVTAKKAHLLIPIGLEKQGAGRVRELSDRMREPVKNLGRTPSMWMLTGHILTEIEALKILADVSAFQAAAGGIGGAEGAVWVVFRGAVTNVRKALRIIGTIHGEPAFVE